MKKNIILIACLQYLLASDDDSDHRVENVQTDERISIVFSTSDNPELEYRVCCGKTTRVGDLFAYYKRIRTVQPQSILPYLANKLIENHDPITVSYDTFLEAGKRYFFEGNTDGMFIDFSFDYRLVEQAEEAEEDIDNEI